MKGILFKPDMIQAIIEGRKTQTRRLGGLEYINKDPTRWVEVKRMSWRGWTFISPQRNRLATPRYQVGETVYVKEAWATEKQYDHLRPSEIPHIAKIFYVSDGVGEWPTNLSIGKLRSPLFMLAWAARYFITITDVRAERLQEISLADIYAEGCPSPVASIFSDPMTGYENRAMAYEWYHDVWNSINKDFPWESNPWDFAYTFKQEMIRRR